MRHDSAHGRIISEWRAEPAAKYPIGCGLMVIVLVAARTDQTDFIHCLCHFRQELANMQPRYIAGDGFVFAANLLHRFGLHIESVMVRDAASEINEDDRFVTPGAAA